VGIQRKYQPGKGKEAKGENVRTVKNIRYSMVDVITAALKKNNKHDLMSDFQAKYGSRFKNVSEYFEYRKSVVQLIDITEIISQFGNAPVGEDTEQE